MMHKIIRLMMPALLLAAMASGLLTGWAGTARAAAVEVPAIAAKCQADLARRLKVEVKEVAVVDATAVTWPDAALGMPENGKAYAQVLTPGWKIILEARKVRYLYTAGKTAFRYGGPAVLWSISMLYLLPVENEPNLNGDLYQCSLLGTNNVRIASGVTDFYPQANGAVIIKRRTSRSSHDLLLVYANAPEKVTTLHAALDFGAATLNGAQDAWAGYVRPALGTGWQVVVSPIGKKDAEPKTFPLPDGVRPGRIAWVDNRVMILGNTEKGTVCFVIDLQADAPAWQAESTLNFPGGDDFLLNKSETLEVTQVTEGGKPSVEVARVWFTGDRNVKAKISGLTLRGCEMLGAGYVFIQGEREGKPAACTVNIVTGEVVPASCGACRIMKPFAYAPVSAP